MVVSESMSSKACFCQMYINHTWNLSVKLRAFLKKKKKKNVEHLTQLLLHSLNPPF